MRMINLICFNINKSGKYKCINVYYQKKPTGTVLGGVIKPYPELMGTE
jgi:hypothetical protein